MTEKNNSSAEILADAVKKKQVCNLERTLDNALARGRAANLIAGTALINLKPLVDPGKWLPLLTSKATQFGVTVRTLQNYMAAARKEDEAKNEKVSFSPATDEQATEIKNADERAKQEYNAEPKSEPNKTQTTKRKPIRLAGIGIYRLPLLLSGDKRDALDELRQSQNWPVASKYILATVDRVLQQFGYTPGPEPHRPTNNDFAGNHYRAENSAE